MIPLTPPRPKVVFTDPFHDYILKHADVESYAPCIPIIVDLRCAGKPTEYLVFRSLTVLLTIYKKSGRNDFTFIEIAQRAPGVSRGRIGDALRALAEKELIDVVGYRETTYRNAKHWPARYAVDMDRLKKLSIEVLADLHREERQPLMLRQNAVSENQSSFDLPDAHDELTVEGAAPAPVLRGVPVRTPITRRRRHAVRLTSGAPRPAANAAVSPPQTPAAPEREADLDEAGALHAQTPAVSEQEAELHAQTPAVSEREADLLALVAAVQREAALQVQLAQREAELAVLQARLEASQRETALQTELVDMQAQMKTMAQIISDLQAKNGPQLGASFTPINLVRPAPVDEAIPLPPDNEPTVDVGPMLTWRDLTGHDVNAREQQQIAELIRRADRASGGYGAYWLVRAMVTASMHPDVQITLSYTGGILRRMERQRVWTTDELQRQRNEPQAEEMAPESARPASSQKVPRGKARTGTPSALGATTPSAPATATPPASDAALELLTSTPPADATAHPAVKAYTLAFKSTPNEVQVQQIIATVTNQAAWARVLLAWRSHGWREGDVANMLDRYRKETGTPIPQEPGQARVTATPIYSAIMDPTARGEWLSRFRSADTNEQRRAVIDAFVKAYPDPDESPPAAAPETPMEEPISTLKAMPFVRVPANFDDLDLDDLD